VKSPSKAQSVHQLARSGARIKHGSHVLGYAKGLMNDSCLQLHMGVTCQCCLDQGLPILQEWACRSQGSGVVQETLETWGRNRSISQEPALNGLKSRSGIPSFS